MSSFSKKLSSLYSRHKWWILLALFLIFLFLLFLIPFLTINSLRELVTNPERIKEFVLSYEKWAILVYVLLSIIVIIAPALPNEIVPVAGGIVFGFWVALIFGITARIIGSTINYWLGTKIRKGFYLKLISDEEKSRINKYTDKIGWQTIFISRFIPSTDTDLIAYLSGIVQMRYTTFILASFFGMLVPVSATILIGSSLLTNKYLFFSLVAFYVIGMLFAPKILRRFVLKGK